ncbi:hypothetical protein N864_16490 [Intrasporangium chromatireducens Q5-1]|uniref:Uncharacterized protein n=2 Tax=Intrasporangium TaxID=53357 RepID=W9GKQ2_9MICO|nr:hypothetical protein N864_16490 [Intrasporangium chromatireducens Q5-1]
MFAWALASVTLAFATASAIKRWMLPEFELIEPGDISKSKRIAGRAAVWIGVISGIMGIWAFLASRK